jgi:hypothetical protein
MGNQARFGSGARSEPQPQDVPGAGQREAPFGPEISWPYGFRPLDPESREVFESAYGTGPLNTSYGSGSVYQPSVMDDYGDPGYSDPSYDGPGYGTPSAPPAPSYPSRPGSHGGGFSGGPASPAGSGGYGTPRGFGGDSRRPSTGGVPGYQLPEAPRVQETSRSGYQAPASGSDIWPVTGAQEALPDTGPQPSAGGRHGSPRSGQGGYPEQWYDNPRLDDRALDDRRLDDQGLNDQRGARSPDPRLEGITYGELRYDDTGSFAAATSDAEPAPSGELLDDESWYQELRRSAPAYPENPAPRGPASGPQRRMEPPSPAGPAFGAPSGGSPSGGWPPAPGRSSGSGPSRWDGPDRPQMSAGPNAPRPTGRGGAPASAGASPISAGLMNPAAQGSGFLGAPVAPAASVPVTPAPSASVGLLTPPGGTRVDTLRNGGAFPAAPGFPAAPPSAATAAPASAATRAGHARTAPATTRRRPAEVRPGHGLDGPGITGSWPTQPVADDDLESYDDFWRDDADEEYTGLFGDREAEHQRAVAKAAAAAKRQIGRRRGRSNDHRLWFVLIAVLVVFAAVLAVVVKFEFLSSHSGPAHRMTVPDKIGAFSRTANLEHSADLNALKAKVIASSAGQASNVVSAVYESGNSAAGKTAQIVMFIGGHLANADPTASIAGFTQQYKGAKVVSAGPGGGQAACVPDGTGANAAAMCVWFDNDSFGELVSPTMNATALAKELQSVRPAVEIRG